MCSFHIFIPILFGVGYISFSFVLLIFAVVVVFIVPVLMYMYFSFHSFSNIIVYLSMFHVNT